MNHIQRELLHRFCFSLSSEQPSLAYARIACFLRRADNEKEVRHADRP